MVDLVHGEHPHSRCDNTTYARWPDGRIEGFDGHRILWEVQLKESNYLKQSDLSGDEVRKGGNGVLIANGVQVYEFFFREIQRALKDASRLIEQLEECPFRIWDEDERQRVKGRKIFWRDQPAIITGLCLDQGCVIIAPDGFKNFVAPPWRENGDDDGERTVKAEVIDPHIWWWRD